MTRYDSTIERDGSGQIVSATQIETTIQ